MRLQLLLSVQCHFWDVTVKIVLVQMKLVCTRIWQKLFEWITFMLWNCFYQHTAFLLVQSFGPQRTAHIILTLLWNNKGPVLWTSTLQTHTFGKNHRNFILHFLGKLSRKTTNYRENLNKVWGQVLELINFSYLVIVSFQRNFIERTHPFDPEEISINCSFSMVENVFKA